MKNTFFIFLLSFITSQTRAQSYLWAYSAGYTPTNQVSSLKRDHIGDLYIITNEDSAGQILNTRLEKRNTSNTILWNLELPGGAYITDVEINSQNHPVIVGCFKGDLITSTDTLSSHAMFSAFLIETFEDGTIFWTVNFNPANDDFMPVDLFIDNNDNIYLTAEMAGATSHGFSSFHKLDQWGIPMHDEFNDDIEVRTFSHILADNSGNIYLSGTCGPSATFDSLQSSSEQYQNFLVKYDANFNAQWIICREYITFDHNNGLGSDGQSLYWSFIEATQFSDTIRFMKTDYNGQIQIERTGPLLTTFFPSITMGTDSGGNNIFISNIYNNIFLFRYDNQFNLLWEDTLLANVSGFPSQIRIACYDSSFYIGSRYYADSLFLDAHLLINPNISVIDADIFVAKWGYPEVVSVPSINGNAAISYFPNPANEKINFYYPGNYSAILTLIDYQGKICYTENISSKKYHEIDLTSVSSGLYLMQISGKDFSFGNKILVQH